MGIKLSPGSQAAGHPSRAAVRSALRGPEVSIVVPTLNEALNLRELAARIDAALADRAYEIILVDDGSADDTQSVCENLAAEFPVRLVVRDTPADGLSGAVLRGLSEARGDLLVVLDADLQHPPESIPSLLAPLETGDADFTIGSRYIAGGSTEAGWGWLRRANSRFATLLARPVAGRTRDPMSGFFALHRDTFHRARQLTPLGYKIGLELMCKCGVDNVREIPIHFGNRHEGESKLGVRQQIKYIEHLTRLYDFQFPRAVPTLKFAIVAAVGWSVALAVYLLLVPNGVGKILSPLLSYPFCALSTAVFHQRYLRAQRQYGVYAGCWRDYWVIAAGEWIMCGLAALWLAAHAPGVPPREMFVLTFAAATVARYVLRKEMLQDLRGLRQLPKRKDASARAKKRFEEAA